MQQHVADKGGAIQLTNVHRVRWDVRRRRNMKKKKKKKKSTWYYTEHARVSNSSNSRTNHIALSASYI